MSGGVCFLVVLVVLIILVLILYVSYTMCWFDKYLDREYKKCADPTAKAKPDDKKKKATGDTFVGSMAERDYLVPLAFPIHNKEGENTCFWFNRGKYV